jgi:uncharacterized protein involved in tolerance to divalent cations
MADIENATLIPISAKTPKKPAPAPRDEAKEAREKVAMADRIAFLSSGVEKLVNHEAKFHQSLRERLELCVSAEETLRAWYQWKDDKKERRKDWFLSLQDVMKKSQELMRRKYVEESYAEGSSTQDFVEGTAKVSWRWEKNV